MVSRAEFEQLRGQLKEAVIILQGLRVDSQNRNTGVYSDKNNVRLRELAEELDVVVLG